VKHVRFAHENWLFTVINLNNNRGVCMRSSIYDTKHLFLTDLVNASTYLKTHCTELLYKIMNRDRNM